MQQRSWIIAAAAPLALVGAGAAAQSDVRLPTADEPLTVDAGGERLRVVLVADGLVAPWDIEFLPDGETMLVTESSGALRIIRDGRLEPEPVWEAPSPDHNDVLHGVVAHPGFSDNRLVYISYVVESDKGQSVAVARGRLVDDRLTDVEQIFVADAWEEAFNATAGRMVFGPDATLYLTIGDRDRLCCGAEDDNSIRMRAQDLSDHVGTTLRLTDTGGVPADNPFVDEPDARPEIFTYGHRNGYGLDFHPETGELWQLEIGPMGGDEINILEAGANYGWPLVSTGRNYSGTLVSEQPWYREGMKMPRMFWVPVISPSSIAFYTGDAFAAWRGNLFVTALSTREVQRIVFGAPGRAERREPMLRELGVRFRDVEQDGAGFIHLSTENRYGSGNPNGTILRLEPAE